MYEKKKRTDRGAVVIMPEGEGGNAGKTARKRGTAWSSGGRGRNKEAMAGVGDHRASREGAEENCLTTRGETKKVKRQRGRKKKRDGEK